MGNYIIFMFLDKIPENAPGIHHALVEIKEANFAALFLVVSIYLFVKVAYGGVQLTKNAGKWD